jgi:hypothetical protein
MFGIEPQVQKRVQALIRFHPNIASFAAVSARWSAARDELLAAKGRNAVSAVTGFYPDLYSVYKHFVYVV